MAFISGMGGLFHATRRRQVLPVSLSIVVIQQAFGKDRILATTKIASYRLASATRNCCERLET